MKPITEADSVNVQGAALNIEPIVLNPATTAATIGATKGAEISPMPGAQACSIAAMLQTTIAIAKPIFVPILSISFPTNKRPIA
jgi:hypothetical protein